MKTFRMRAVAVATAVLTLAGGAAAVAQGDADAKGRKGARAAAALNRSLAATPLQARTLRAAAEYLGLERRELAQALPGTSLAALAQAQGKSAEGLEQAVLAPITARLDRAVTNGRITAEQRQTLLAAVSTRVDRLLARVWPDPMLRRLRAAVPVVTVREAARFLGVTVRELRTQVRGKSLNALVQELGKDPAALRAGILARFDARLDRAVTNGRTTQARAGTVLAKLAARVDAALARVRG